MMSGDENQNPRPAEKLCGVRVGVRADIEISRHTFRGQPAYVARDPITFQSQKLDPEDYAIFCRITPDRSLGETFALLVSNDRLCANDEDRFYDFILSLHTLGFLRLPVSDDKMLFKRYMLREQMRRREKFTNILFFRIPVWNPNAFLDRTIGVMRPLFSPCAYAAWAALMACAAFIVVQNYKDLMHPLASILAGDNMLLIWLTLIGLKVLHEFGHAYACKHFGGHVPEMGIFLILFTPCAYVDATASWGFPKKRHRLFVSLAGMYVEMAIAAIAVIVWSATGPSTLNSVAHNVIFLASTVTVLFNVNPLMRYDGYYVLCDLLEIPNLRARSSRCLLAQTKRLLLGIAPPPETGGRRLTVTLCCFGVAAFLYRMFLMIAIAAVLASKMFVAGLIAGGIMIGKTVAALALRLTKYLWYAEETVSRRVRAVAISVVILLLVPAGVMWLPVRNNVRAAGITQRAREFVIRAPTPGFVEEVFVEPGATVPIDTPIARLENESVRERLLDTEAQLRASQIRADAYRLEQPDKLGEESATAQGILAQHTRISEQVRSLSITATAGGDIVQSITESDRGRFLREGEPVATISSGAWHVRAVLASEQLAASAPRIGTPVTFRTANDPTRFLTGHIVRVVPAGTHTVSIKALTQLGGREIAVDPGTQQAREPYFEVTAVLTDAPTATLRVGLTGEIQLRGKREPLGVAVVRRIIRFWNKLRRD